jgi:hypothetical protein
MASKTVAPLRAQSTAEQSTRHYTDELNNAAHRIGRARGVLDVLYSLSAHGGEIALEQLGPESLATTLSTVDDLLREASEFVNAGFTAERREVAHA